MFVPNNLVRVLRDALAIGAERTVSSLIQFGKAGAELISDIRARFPSMATSSVNALIRYSANIFQAVTVARRAPGNSILEPPQGPPNPFLPKGITYRLAIPYRTDAGQKGRQIVEIVSSSPLGKVALYRLARQDFAPDYLQYEREHGRTPEPVEFIGQPQIISIEKGSAS